jgi:hypothetical protein
LRNPERVVEEEILHPLVARRAHLGVVGRVQVEKRETLRLADRVEEVAVNCCDPTSRRGRRAACAQLDTVLFDLGAFGQLMKCCAGAGAGIRRARAIFEYE